MRFTIARRATALLVLALFAGSARFGWTLLVGDLSASKVLGIVPMADPLAMLERLAAGIVPTASVALGALLATVLYALTGGRAFCGWICPLNIVTEAGSWLRRKFDLPAETKLPRSMRYALLAGVLLASLATGTAAFEPVSPQAVLWRDLVWGTGLSALSAALGILSLELAAGPDLWCGRLCPLGAFWALVGRINPKPLVRITFEDAACTRCGDCLRVCPEQQILRFKNLAQTGRVPSGECLLCGRCISVCPEDALRWRIPIVPEHQSSIPKKETQS